MFPNIGRKQNNKGKELLQVGKESEHILQLVYQQSRTALSTMNGAAMDSNPSHPLAHAQTISQIMNAAYRILLYCCEAVMDSNPSHPLAHAQTISQIMNAAYRILLYTMQARILYSIANHTGPQSQFLPRGINFWTAQHSRWPLWPLAIDKKKRMAPNSAMDRWRAVAWSIICAATILMDLLVRCRLGWMYISRRKLLNSRSDGPDSRPKPRFICSIRPIRTGLRVGVLTARQSCSICVLPYIQCILYIMADLEHKIRGDKYICVPDRVLGAMFLVTYKSWYFFFSR